MVYLESHIEDLQGEFSAYYQSDNIDELTTALFKARIKMQLGLRNYKSIIEDFRCIIIATRPFLEENGLSIFQGLRIDENGMQILSTILLHRSSNQWIEISELIGFNIDINSHHFIYLKMKSYIVMTGIVIPKLKWREKLILQDGLREISWKQISLFLQCQRCFYRELKRGKKRPGIDPESFKITTKIDELVKNEMNFFRKWKAHPQFMANHGIDAVPYNDKYNSIKKWQTTKRKKNNIDVYDGGIRFYDYQTNFDLFGSVDDVWINNQNELIIVEYKTTAKGVNICITSDAWYENYRRQVAYYTWLFKKNGYAVSTKAYFFYINVGENQYSFMPFDKNLKCYVSISSYEIDDSWVQNTIKNMRSCLNQSKPPIISKDQITNRICEYCDFAQSDKN